MGFLGWLLSRQRFRQPPVTLSLAATLMTRFNCCTDGEFKSTHQQIDHTHTNLVTTRQLQCLLYVPLLLDKVRCWFHDRPSLKPLLEEVRPECGLHGPIIYMSNIQRDVFFDECLLIRCLPCKSHHCSGVVGVVGWETRQEEQGDQVVMDFMIYPT